MKEIMQNRFLSIELLRFPLAVLIITIHFPGKTIDNTISNLGVDWIFSTELDLWVRIFFSCLSDYAVPIFFCISGYLFYKGVTEFSRDLYKKKLYSRLYSLFIPYIVWNIIRFVFELPTKGFDDIMMIFIAPANGQFWFVRDLIYLSILSPVLFYLIKKVGLCLPVICYFISSLHLSTWSIHDGLLTNQAILYFSLGSFFSIKGIDINEYFKKISRLSIFLMVSYISLRFIFYFSELNSFLSIALLIVSIPGLFNLTSLVGGKTQNFLLNLAGTSFFIFASHKIIGVCVQGFFCIIGLKSIFWSDYFFIFRISLIASSCIFSYFVIKKYCPFWMFKVLSGNRK